MHVVVLKPQSHQVYDQVTTYLWPKSGSIVEITYDWSQRSYDWSQRSWVIAGGKSVATRSMVMFKTWNLLFQIVSGRTSSRATGRATLRRWHHQSIAHAEFHDWSYDRSSGATIDRTIDHLWLPLVVRFPSIWWILSSIFSNRCWSRDHAYDQSYDDLPPAKKTDRSVRPTTSGDRSKHCRSVARSPNHNQSYDQAIVRSGVTVGLGPTRFHVFFSWGQLHFQHRPDNRPAFCGTVPLFYQMSRVPLNHGKCPAFCTKSDFFALRCRGAPTLMQITQLNVITEIPFDFSQKYQTVPRPNRRATVYFGTQLISVGFLGPTSKKNLNVGPANRPAFCRQVPLFYAKCPSKTFSRLAGLPAPFCQLTKCIIGGYTFQLLLMGMSAIKRIHDNIRHIYLLWGYFISTFIYTR